MKNIGTRIRYLGADGAGVDLDLGEGYDLEELKDIFDNAGEMIYVRASTGAVVMFPKSRLIDIISWPEEEE